MKLEEMADLLDGLAGTLEKSLAKTPLNDLRAVSECLRKFPGENTATFCNWVIQAKEGKVSARRSPSGMDEAKIDDHVKKIRHFLDHRHSYDYATIKDLVLAVGKLKADEIKAVGKQINCPLSGTKTQMTAALENWLTNIKMSADQSSFHLAGAGAS